MSNADTLNLVEKGDLVLVKDLPSSMSHFTTGQAVVVGSYHDRFGRGSSTEFILLFQGQGESAWYPAECLEILEKGRHDLLQTWRDEITARRERESDLDWIFSEEHRHVGWALPGASAQALADHLGLGNLWGPRGEGRVYQVNYQTISSTVAPLLLLTDGKERFLKMAAEIKALSDQVMAKPATGCEGCRYLVNTSAEQHCYMFKEKPEGSCSQYTARESSN